MQLEFLDFSVETFQLGVISERKTHQNLINAEFSFEKDGNGIIMNFKIDRSIKDDGVTCHYVTVSKYKVFDDNVSFDKLLKSNSTIALLAELVAITEGQHYGAFSVLQKGTPIENYVYPIRTAGSYYTMMTTALRQSFN